MSSDQGHKFDTDKPRWDLLLWPEIETIVKVLTYGAKKYGEYNWVQVEPFKDRYFAAFMRHIVAWQSGEDIDAESGLPHLAHAACSILFLMHGGH